MAPLGTASAFFTSPSPRERIQRGQFQEAARDLTDKQQAFARGLERLRSFDSAEIAEWCKAANEMYDQLSRARYPNVGQTTPQPDSDPNVVMARNAVEQFWMQQPTAQLLMDQASAALGYCRRSW